MDKFGNRHFISSKYLVLMKSYSCIVLICQLLYMRLQKPGQISSLRNCFHFRGGNDDIKIRQSSFHSKYLALIKSYSGSNNQPFTIHRYLWLQKIGQITYLCTFCGWKYHFRGGHDHPKVRQSSFHSKYLALKKNSSGSNNLPFTIH